MTIDGEPCLRPASSPNPSKKPAGCAALHHVRFLQPGGAREFGNPQPPALAAGRGLDFRHLALGRFNTAIRTQAWDEETLIACRKRFTDEIEAWLDRGIGECFLKNPGVREIVSSALHHFDGDRYRIDSYVIMPNHIHVLFQIFPPHLLPDVMRTLKTYTARLANKELGRDGAFWQRDYHDRLIRSPKHFHWARRYIERNPRNLQPGTFTLWMR